MPAAMDLVAFVLLLPTVAAAVAWCIALVHLVRMVRVVPTARAGLAEDASDPENGPEARVLVVVPAHNERDTIAGLVRSLRAQRGVDLRVVLMLDRCTDDTRALAEQAADGDERIQILENDACPDDWAGKVHAVWAGLERSGWRDWATHLIFTDADTEFDPDCIRATLTLMRRRALGLLSLLSTLSTETGFERVVQPMAAFELIRQYPLVRVNRAEDRRSFANGQFLMFTTEAYEACGGHGAVRGALLEDIALARAVKRSGHRGGLFLADGLLRCRMYGSDTEFVRGWKRIYTEAANQRADRLGRYALLARLIGAVAPVVSALASVVGGVMLALGFDGTPQAALFGFGVVGVLAWATVMAVTQRLSHAPLRVIPLLPWGAWRVGGILASAARDLREQRPIEWAGRSYLRPDRSGQDRASAG